VVQVIKAEIGIKLMHLCQKLPLIHGDNLYVWV